MNTVKRIQKDFQDTMEKMYKLGMKYKLVTILIIITIILILCLSRKESFINHQTLPELHDISEESYGFVCDMEDKECQFPIPVMKIIVEDKRGLQYMKFKMIDEEGISYYTKMYQLEDDMLKLGSYLYFDNGKVMLIIEIQE